MKYSLCDKYGFDALKCQQYIDLMGLTPDCHELIQYLHDTIIQRKAGSIVEEFYERLLSYKETRSFIKNSNFLDLLKETQCRYLKTYGLQFDSMQYFEQRLQVGEAHARIHLPLRYYQTAFRILDDILIDNIVSTLSVSNANFVEMIKLVSKVSTLDMSLAIETYHNVHVYNMSSSIKALRDEHKSLSSIIDHDELTQVASRTRIMEYLTYNIRHAAEEYSVFCVAMIDLDHFKSVNDQYGHLTGDQVLKGVAARMMSTLREDDMLGRFGGEEFILIIPSVLLISAEKILTRLCHHLSAQPFHINKHVIPVTVSIGVSAYRRGDDDNKLIARADKAMYEAKHNGRNQVVAG